MNSIRMGMRWACMAAIAWFALGMESILRPGPHNWRDGAWFVPFTLSLVAFSYVHLAQGRSDRKFERVSFYMLVFSMILVMMGNAGLVFEIKPLQVLAFPLGALIWTVALIAWGVATYRAGVFPRLVGVAIALLEPGSIAAGVALAPIAGLSDRGGYSAGVEKGLVLAIVAWGFVKAQHQQERSRSQSA